MKFSSIARPYKLRLNDAAEVGRRSDICAACSNSDGAHCSLCGCPISGLISYAEAECGAGKW